MNENGNDSSIKDSKISEADDDDVVQINAEPVEDLEVCFLMFHLGLLKIFHFRQVLINDLLMQAVFVNLILLT